MEELMNEKGQNRHCQRERQGRPKNCDTQSNILKSVSHFVFYLRLKARLKKKRKKNMKNNILCEC